MAKIKIESRYMNMGNNWIQNTKHFASELEERVFKSLEQNTTESLYDLNFTIQFDGKSCTIPFDADSYDNMLTLLKETISEHDTEYNEEFFSEWFYIIPEHDAKMIFKDGGRGFLILSSEDGSDRYADGFDSWEEIERDYPNALFGFDKE